MVKNWQELESSLGARRGMGLTTRRVVREPKGATKDGTHETNAISLCIDTELAGGTLTVLLALALITVTLITDYLAEARTIY
jgi:hypothetical protein